MQQFVFGPTGTDAVAVGFAVAVAVALGVAPASTVGTVTSFGDFASLHAAAATAPNAPNAMSAARPKRAPAVGRAFEVGGSAWHHGHCVPSRTCLSQPSQTFSIDRPPAGEHSSDGPANELLDSTRERRVERAFAEMLEACRAGRVASERVVHAGRDEELGARSGGERPRLVLADDPVVLALDDEERATQTFVRRLDTCILQLTVEGAAAPEEDLVRRRGCNRVGLGLHLAIDDVGRRTPKRELAPGRRGHALGPTDARRAESDRRARRRRIGEKRKHHASDAVSEEDESRRIDVRDGRAEVGELGLEIERLARTALAVAEPAALETERREPEPRELVEEKTDRRRRRSCEIDRRARDALEEHDHRMRPCASGDRRDGAEPHAAVGDRAVLDAASLEALVADAIRSDRCPSRDPCAHERELDVITAEAKRGPQRVRVGHGDAADRRHDVARQNPGGGGHGTGHDRRRDEPAVAKRILSQLDAQPKTPRERYPRLMEHALHLYHQSVELLVTEVKKRAPHRRVVALDTPEALAAALPEITVLCAPVPPREGWSHAQKLRLIQLLGVGADMLLPSLDLPRAVEVATLRGVFAAEVTEHVLAMMLALVRAVPTLVARQHVREWVQFGSGTLAGKTIGLVGLGAIGSRLARAATALDMRVLATRRTLGTSVRHVERVYAAGDLDEMLRESDFVVVCVPKTVETTRLFDRARFLGMKPGAILVNVARGGIVDEDALLEALSSGHLGGAAIDVFAEEPLPPSNALWTAPNTIVTPHVAGWGRDYVVRSVEVLLENVSRREADARRGVLVDRTVVC